MGFKTLLSIPPDYDRNYPPLGTPALLAFLRKNAVASFQIDLNLEYRDFLAQNISGSSPLGVKEQRLFFKPAMEKYFAGKVSGHYYSKFLPQGNGNPLTDLSYGNNTNSSFYFCERLISSEHLWRYLEDTDENTFLQFYEASGILDRLKKDDIGLFGISVISPTQVIASLTLGLLIKKSMPHIHVTIGGQWPTLYRDAILGKKELFRCFDSVVVFEGETALLKLVKALEAKRDISSIPNVIVSPVIAKSQSPSHPSLRGAVVFHEATKQSINRFEEDLNSLPCPDFDGLPLKDYDDSRDGNISLTYESSRGCYWSRCAYCVDLPLPKPSYRTKDPALVVNDIYELKRRYGAECLMLSDPAVSPRQMGEISKRIIEKDAKVEWWAFARLDPGFDRKLFDLAFKAGFRQINFGFESANDRVCKLLDKGNERERSARIIKDCSAAGIRVGLQTILGLPNETFEDGLDTVDFLVANKELIYRTVFNIYYLTPFNFVHENPQKYGLEYDNDPDMPFRFFIPFKNRRGMDEEKADLLKKMYLSLVGNDGKREFEGVPGKDDISEGHVNFQLNGISCRVGYRYNKTTDIYLF